MKLSSFFLSFLTTMAACSLVTVAGEKNGVDHVLGEEFLCRSNWCAEQLEGRRLESSSKNAMDTATQSGVEQFERWDLAVGPARQSPELEWSVDQDVEACRYV